MRPIGVFPILDEIAAEHADKLTVTKLSVDANPKPPYDTTSWPIAGVSAFDNVSLAKTVVGDRQRDEK